MKFSDLAERQIRKAQAAGTFDNLTYSGKPLDGSTGGSPEMRVMYRTVTFSSSARRRAGNSATRRPAARSSEIMRFENRAIQGAVKTKCRTALPFAAVAPDYDSLIGKQFLTRLAHVGILAIAPTIATDLIDRAGQSLRSRLCT